MSGATAKHPPMHPESTNGPRTPSRVVGSSLGHSLTDGLSPKWDAPSKRAQRIVSVVLKSILAQNDAKMLI